jgi:tRNA dimethylallyltransferase
VSSWQADQALLFLRRYEENVQEEMNKVIILLGPTGVGKTDVSILLAKKLETEIISADSMQIYRHMDVGTAKPSKEERSLVTHHMIDIVDPWEAFSTGKYISMVVPIIENLHKRGKTPIIVGGTGLYIKAMTRGIFRGPSADWTLRKELLSMEKEESGSLYNYLKDLDRESAKKITPNDSRRIIRALEVCLKSNIRISDMQKQLTMPLPYEFIKIGITRDRKELYRMIEKRVDEMIEKGLLDEVKRVIKMIPAADHEESAPYPFPSLQAIGYKEFTAHLRGDITLDDAIRFIKRNSKRYAKRQFTWFRKEEDIYWVDISGIQDSSEAFMRIMFILNELLQEETLQY